MNKRTITTTILIQAVCWGIVVLILTQKNSLAVNALVQTSTLQPSSTPHPFLGPIYFNREDVWNVFDHNLPCASVCDDDLTPPPQGTPTNVYVVHYDGSKHDPVTPTPQGYPYIPGGYGYDEHGGIDYSLIYEPVLAATTGTVQYAGWSDAANHRRSYGLYVILDHTPETNYDTWYGHFSTLVVQTGDEIVPSDLENRNRILGISGNTGAAFGPNGVCGSVGDDPLCGTHLHFEVRLSGQGYKPVNPYGWIASTTTPDPWVNYTPTPPAPSGAVSYNLWATPPSLVSYADQYPGTNIPPLPEPELDGARLIIDDSSADFTVIPGSCWQPVGGGGSYNGDFRRAVADTTPYCVAQWHIRPDAFTPAGEYDLFTYVPQGQDWTLGAEYTIRHDSKTHTAIAVQAAYPNAEHDGWVYLGRYDFAMDDSVSEYVRLTTHTIINDPDTYVTADAIKLIPADPETPPVDVIYVSFADREGIVGDVHFAGEDILAYNTQTGNWSILFDGSDVGLAERNVNAFGAKEPAFLLSFDESFEGIDPSQLARFIPTSLGSNTSGSFSLYFQDEFLDEDVDAVHLMSDDDLILSPGSTEWVPGHQFMAADLFRYERTDQPADPFSMWLDGSGLGLAWWNNINGVWVDEATDRVYLTTAEAFEIGETSGDGADIFTCLMSSIGSEGDECTLDEGLYWNGSAHGMGNYVVDSIFVGSLADCQAFANGGFELQLLCWTVDKYSTNPSSDISWLATDEQSNSGLSSARGRIMHEEGHIQWVYLDSSKFPVTANNTHYNFQFYGKVIPAGGTRLDSKLYASIEWYQNGIVDPISYTSVAIFDVSSGPVDWTQFSSGFICPPENADAGRWAFEFGHGTLLDGTSSLEEHIVFIDDVTWSTQPGLCPVE